jgi:hypothetical protein
MSTSRRSFALAASLASLALIAAGCGGGSDGGGTPTTWAISGTVSGAVSAGVTVSLSGTATASTTTDASGNYAFSGLANGSYTVTPSLAGYSFAPSSLGVTVNGASLTGRNFTAVAAPTYSISGTVAGAVSSGVTITLGGAVSRTTATDGSGNYVFTGLYDGAYTLAPSLSGYTFAPISLAVTVSGGNVTGRDFLASTSAGPTYSIAGTVSGAVVAGVTMTLGGAASGSASTNASGNYSFGGLADGSYTVTPTLPGYSFSPTSTAVTVAGANVTGRNFTATALTYSLSGRITGLASASATVTLGGAASRTTTTSAGGDFTFTGLVNGSYTVTPSAAGFAFAPTSRAVTVTGGDVTGVDFSATLQAVYSISGTVSGAVVAGVTVTLAGTATASTTTNGAGSFSFANLTSGAYTVTPSLSHYAFTPASRSVTVSGASQAGQDFTSAAAATYTLSGAVTGPWVENVRVTLGGGASATTFTDSSGAYAFLGLYAGSYTVTPSLAGYAYAPSSPTVAIAAADATQDFTASPAIGSYSISGTVSFGGTGTGRIYVSVVSTNCTGCSPQAGTSIAAPGAYTVKGLGSGSYQVVAWMDLVGKGARNILSPSGTSGTVTIGSANLTGVDLGFSPTSMGPPQTPTGLGVFPGSRSAVLFWNGPSVNGIEAATAYKIYWGTDAAASNQAPVTVPAMDNQVYIQGPLTDGAVYYYKITSLLGPAESAASTVVGPITIGALPGANVLTGSVTFPATATGPLYVGAFDQNGGLMRATRIASPVSPQAFTVTGIPSGSSYFAFAILDQNDNGLIDAGDLSNTNGGGNQVIAITGATSHDITLSGANAEVRITTQHQVQQGSPGSDFYGMNLRVSGQVKLPVAVTLYSGAGVAVPVDFPKNFDFQTFLGLGSSRPNPGGAYGFKIWYSDGTSELKTGSVTAVLDTFARSLSVTPAPSANVPTFSWVAPASPPAPSYTYRLSLYGPGANWYYPRNDGMPSTQVSAQYNVDGNANPSSLVTGSTYTWAVVVQDLEGNEASIQTTYTP